MQRGVIGRIDGGLGRIDSFSRTREEDGFELSETVDVTRVKRTPGGLDVTLGQAARQEVAEREAVTLSNGGISTSTDVGVETSHTDFLTVGDEFAAVGSSDGTFAFDLLAERFGVDVARASVDLDSLWAGLDAPTPWKVGFFGNDGPVENGVVHGEDVLEDGVFGRAISELEKNQLGVLIEDGDRSFKFLITASGYLELYQPRDLETAGFAEFVAENVLPHAD
jgi:hypothetical protein